MAKFSLSDMQKEKFQQKLSGVMRGMRYRNHWMAKDAAKLLGLDASRYSKLENPTIPYPKFITAIEFLYSIARLEKGFTLTELMDRLESDPKNKELRLTAKEQSLILAMRHLNSEENESIARMVKVLVKRAEK